MRSAAFALRTFPRRPHILAGVKKVSEARLWFFDKKAMKREMFRQERHVEVALWHFEESFCLQAACCKWFEVEMILMDGQGQFQDGLSLNASKQGFFFCPGVLTPVLRQCTKKTIYSALLGRSSGYLASCCLHGISSRSAPYDFWPLTSTRLFLSTQLLLTHRSAWLYASSTVCVIGRFLAVEIKHWNTI